MEWLVFEVSIKVEEFDSLGHHMTQKSFIDFSDKYGRMMMVIMMATMKTTKAAIALTL